MALIIISSEGLTGVKTLPVQGAWSMGREQKL
jgi:hypothetical protein